MTRDMHDPVRRAKAAWATPITDNERAWIEFIWLASGDTDPAPTLDRVQRLRSIFRGDHTDRPDSDHHRID